MKEILESYTIELLEALKTGANFVIGEMPKVAEELLKYSAAEAIVMIVLFGGLSLGSIIISVIVLKHLLKLQAKYNATDWNDPSDSIEMFCYILAGSIVLSVILFIVAACTVPSYTLELIKIQTAPRLFLLEYLKGFIK